MKANHREAYELACMKHSESNLALAYIELSHFAAKYVKSVEMRSKATPEQADDAYDAFCEAQVDLCEIFKELVR